MRPTAITWKPDRTGPGPGSGPGPARVAAYFWDREEPGPARFSDTEGYNRAGRAEYEAETELEEEWNASEGIELGRGGLVAADYEPADRRNA